MRNELGISARANEWQAHKPEPTTTVLRDGCHRILTLGQRFKFVSLMLDRT